MEAVRVFLFADHKNHHESFLPSKLTCPGKIVDIMKRLSKRKQSAN